MEALQANTLYQYGYTAFWILITAFIVMMFVGAVKEKKALLAVVNALLGCFGIFACLVRFGFIASGA